MSERIKPEQIANAKEKSRRFEHAWNVLTYPLKHTPEEVETAYKLMRSNKELFEVMIACPPDPDGWQPEEFDKVFAGLFHTDVQYPPNFTERDFKEN